MDKRWSFSDGGSASWRGRALRGGEVPPLPERAPLARGCSAATADRHYYMREAASAAGERAKKAYEDGELLLDEG